MSVNKIILVGRLIKDPEMKTLKSDSKVTEFTIATNERYTNKAGEKVEETEFHNIVAWGKSAEIINQYKKKGEEMYIEGKVKTRSWDNDQGVKQYKNEVILSSFTFIGNKAAATTTPTNTPTDLDLPF